MAFINFAKWVKRISIGVGLALTESASGQWRIDRYGATGGGKITSAAAATPVVLIPTANVPSGRAFFLEGFRIKVDGGTAWTDSTATVLYLKDNNNVLFATIAKSALTANALINQYTSGVTMAAPYTTPTGGTADYGFKIVGDAVFAAGSDISCDVFGYFA